MLAVAHIPDGPGKYLLNVPLKVLRKILRSYDQNFVAYFVGLLWSRRVITVINTQQVASFVAKMLSV